SARRVEVASFRARSDAQEIGTLLRRQRELRLGGGASEPRVSAQQFTLRAAPSRVHCVARFLRSPAREAVCRCCSCCVLAERVRICTITFAETDRPRAVFCFGDGCDI